MMDSSGKLDSHDSHHFLSSYFYSNQIVKNHIFFLPSHFPIFHSIFTTTNPVVSLEKKGSLLVSFSLIALIYILFLDFLMNDFFFLGIYIQTLSKYINC